MDQLHLTLATIGCVTRGRTKSSGEPDSTAVRGIEFEWPSLRLDHAGRMAGSGRRGCAQSADNDSPWHRETRTAPLSGQKSREKAWAAPPWGPRPFSARALDGVGRPKTKAKRDDCVFACGFVASANRVLSHR